ncbi:MAG: NTP transferase domain-containing protein [Candidatus Bipolaricaulota bacterium]
MIEVAYTPLALVVLAAGLGSRFGGPKQVEPVGPSGETLLDYSIYDALSAGFSHIVFVVREEVEDVLRRRLGPALGGRCRRTFVRQRLDDVPVGIDVPAARSRPWGTGQAVLACRGALEGSFAVVNADDFYGADGFARVAAFLRDGRGPAPWRNALVGYRLSSTLTESGTVSRGICAVNSSGDLESIVECHGVGRRADGAIGYDDRGTWRPLEADAVASMNFWGLDASVLPLLERGFRRFLATGPGDHDEFRLPTAIGDLIDEGAVGVRVLQANAEWLGVTHRADLDGVRRRIGEKVAAGEYPSPLWTRN